MLTLDSRTAAPAASATLPASAILADTCWRLAWHTTWGRQGLQDTSTNHDVFTKTGNDQRTAGFANFMLHRNMQDIINTWHGLSV